MTDQAGSSTTAFLSCILGVFVSNIGLDIYYRKFPVVLLGHYKQLLEKYFKLDICFPPYYFQFIIH